MRAKQDQAFDDQYYIQLILAGDNLAFTFLVERYKHMVYTLAVRMLRNHEEAEEAAQDTFVRVFNGLKAFEGNAKFSTWIYKIAYNQCLDYIKRRKKPEGILLSFTGNEAKWATGPEIDERYEEDSLKYKVKRALNSLQEEDGLIISLFYMEGLPIKAISKILGIRANATKVRLHRARKRLMAFMAHQLSQYTTERHEK